MTDGFGGKSSTRTKQTGRGLGSPSHQLQQGASLAAALAGPADSRIGRLSVTAFGHDFSYVNWELLKEVWGRLPERVLATAITAMGF